MDSLEIKKILMYHIHEVNNGSSIISNTIKLILRKLDDLNVSQAEKDDIAKILGHCSAGSKKINDSVDYSYSQLSKIWKKE